MLGGGMLGWMGGCDACRMGGWEVRGSGMWGWLLHSLTRSLAPSLQSSYVDSSSQTVITEGRALKRDCKEKNGSKISIFLINPSKYIIFKWFKMPSMTL
jgi:hypothetical protein